MGFFSAVGKVGRHLVDVRVDKWVGYQYLKGSFQTTFHFTTKLFKPAIATHHETFEESLKRLQLTEEDLLHRKKEFTMLLYFYLVMTASLFVYSLHIASNKQVWGFLICFMLMLYCLSQAFHFHFWLFQLKHRKLGCTIQEWWSSKLSGD